MAANGIYECHKCLLPQVVGLTIVQVHENGGKRSEKYM